MRVRRWWNPVAVASAVRGTPPRGEAKLADPLGHYLPEPTRALLDVQPEATRVLNHNVSFGRPPACNTDCWNRRRSQQPPNASSNSLRNIEVMLKANSANNIVTSFSTNSRDER